MKKILGVIALLGVLLSLAGCPNRDKETQRPPSSGFHFVRLAG